MSAPIILAPGPFDQLQLGPAVLAGVLYGLVFCWALAPGSSFWRCAFLLDNFVGRQIALLRARWSRRAEGRPTAVTSCARSDLVEAALPIPAPRPPLPSLRSTSPDPGGRGLPDDAAHTARGVSVSGTGQGK